MALTADPTTRGQHTQVELSEFALPTVELDEEGNPIPPDSVAGYYRSPEETTQVAVWSAPSRTERRFCGGLRIQMQRRLYVIVDDVRGEDGYVVGLCEARKKPFSVPKTRVAQAETAVEAVEAAVDWMLDFPAPDNPEQPIQIDPAKEMHYRRRDEAAECLRLGSVVEIDNLPESVVVGRLDSTEPDNVGEYTTDSATWLCETPIGIQFEIRFSESQTKRQVGYTCPGERLADDAELVEPQYIAVSNEDNLRDDVHEETYEWLTKRVGSTVIQETSEGLIQVHELDEVRDGAVNPPKGAVVPDKTRSSRDAYIDSDHAGTWYDCPFDLEPGAYRVIEQGLVDSGDRYGATVLVDSDEWESYDLPTPENPPSRSDVDLQVALPDDRPGLDPTDHVTEVIGIGEATAEEVWKDEVGPLYDDGWPLPFVSPQYQSRAIAEMFALSQAETGEINRSDAVRVVVGMLGGVAYDDSGERLGCTANAIFGNLNIDEAARAWLNSGNAIKKEYCPNWSVVGNGNDGVTVFGAGDIEVGDVNQWIADSHRAGDVEPEEVEYFDVTEVLEAVDTDRDTVAVSGDGEPYVEIQKRPLEIAASIARCDLSESIEAQDVQYWPDGSGEGIVLINSPEGTQNVVLDTDGWIQVDEIESPDGE